MIFPKVSRLVPESGGSLGLGSKSESGVEKKSEQAATSSSAEKGEEKKCGWVGLTVLRRAIVKDCLDYCGSVMMCLVKNQSYHVSAGLKTVIFVEYLLIYLFYHCFCFLIIYFVELSHTFKYKNAFFASDLSKYVHTLSFEFGLCLIE